jgi:hypothetical protein
MMGKFGYHMIIFRCNDDCEVEKGWECIGGDPVTIDTCTEVCGDGYNFNNYNCDDGNVDYPSSLYGNDG